MAERSVYRVKNIEPFNECKTVEFVFNSGFAVSQKQKNVIAIHDAYHRIYPNDRILEISTKSLQPLGVSLSAFNLLKYVPSTSKSIPVENVYQGGKIFEQGGPFFDLYNVPPREAKKDERLEQSGKLEAFCFEGEAFPLFPKTAFYDWLYITAIFENENLIKSIIEYDAFTDVEFDPKKSLNCQARAAAIFVSLYRLGKLDRKQNYNEFMNTLHTS